MTPSTAETVEEIVRAIGPVRLKHVKLHLEPTAWINLESFDSLLEVLKVAISQRDDEIYNSNASHKTSLIKELNADLFHKARG